MSNPYPKCKRCEKRRKLGLYKRSQYIAGYYRVTVTIESDDICASCKDYLLGLALAAIIEDAKP